jgi:preprotein translocase subunit SecF
MGENVYFLRTVTVNEENKSKLLKSLEGSLSPSGVQVLSFDTVSPLVAGEIVRAAIWAVIAAAVGIFLYLWWAFRNVPSPIRYGCAAIVALIHDVLIVIGVFALLGYLWEIEVNSMFLIAVLTIIGYSVNDTIVVFDRLRENIILYPNRKFENNVSVSIFETLGRSLNTSFTLLFTLLALILFGGQTIREFLWVLLIGVIVGTYSSIGVATQVLVVWEKGLIKKIFKRETIGSTA